MRAIFDTGSTNLWVLCANCSSSRNLSDENYLYEPDKSKSFEGTNIGAQVTFGSGSLLGFFAKDDMRLGGTGDDSKWSINLSFLDDTEHDVVHVKKQTFGVATGE